jgi:4-hydroxy-tetrahydrodipicolinate synthase
MSVFTGSAVAIVTPFKKDKSIDFDALENLLDWQLEQGTDAICICGTTGETSTLTLDEDISAIAFTVDRVAGRVPVIAGSGSNDTQFACLASKKCEEVGADGLLVVSPYYNKTTDKGLVEHYEKVAASTKLPLIMYSVPGRTGVNISPAVCEILAKTENIVGIKEASGDIAQVAEISLRTPKDFAVYSGNDDMIVPLLSVGGKGVISVLANVAPKQTHDMVMSFLNGNTSLACDMQLEALPLINALFSEVNPIPVKAALNMMGLCEYEYRLPLTTMGDATYEQLKTEMKKYGLI